MTQATLMMEYSHFLKEPLQQLTSVFFNNQGNWKLTSSSFIYLEFVEHLFIFFRFCVLVAGFISRTQSHKKTFNAMIEEHQTKVSIPTLHVFGDTDRYSIILQIL